VRGNKAADTSLSYFYFKMINPLNVMKIFSDRASTLLPSGFSESTTTSNIITNREYEVGELLCGVLESVINSHSHTVDIETTLDHEALESELIDEMKHENEVEEALNPEWSDEGEDEDKAFCKEFSLEYMTRAVNFYDEVNPNTGKRKRRWDTVKHNFQRIPHQNYIARFRDYLERFGTKKQKLEKIDDHVFDMFEHARENALSVHDIDLRRWALKKAMDESLHNFVASTHWLYNFKYKHNIVSRRVTKVSDL
jgi:DNA-binding ferritin-like protein (Dps family)